MKTKLDDFLINERYPFINHLVNKDLDALSPLRAKKLIKSLTEKISEYSIQKFSDNLFVEVMRIRAELEEFFPVIDPVKGCILLSQYEEGWENPEEGIFYYGVYYKINPANEVPFTGALFFRNALIASFFITSLDFSEGVNMTIRPELHYRELDIDLVKTAVRILELVTFLQYKPTEYVDLYSGVSHHNVRSKELIEYMDTSIKINCYDISWYREINVNREIDVREHTRRQPYGKGRRLTKDIEVGPYTKKGYHRRAKKDLINNH
jgi:hypothetical protein